MQRGPATTIVVLVLPPLDSEGGRLPEGCTRPSGTRWWNGSAGILVDVSFSTAPDAIESLSAVRLGVLGFFQNERDTGRKGNVVIRIGGQR